MGFLYTFVVKVPSDWGVTNMSKKGMEPSGLASSTVLDGSIHCVDVLEKLLILWLLMNYKCVINIPPPDHWGVQCSIDGSMFKGLHLNIGHNWTYRWPHGSSFGLFKTGFGIGSMCWLDRTPPALWCYWLTRWFYLGVLCPVQT